jgi:hypothetical protein
MGARRAGVISPAEKIAGARRAQAVTVRFSLAAAPHALYKL